MDLSLERHAPQLRALRRRPAALLGSRHRRQSGLPAAARPGTVSLVHDAHRDRLPLLAAGIHGRLHRRLLVQPAARPARSSGQDVDDRGRDPLLHDVARRGHGVPGMGRYQIATRSRSGREAQPGSSLLVTALIAGAVGGLLFFGFVYLLEKFKRLLRRPQRSLACRGIRHHRGPQAPVPRRGAPRRAHGQALFRWRARVVEPTRRSGDCIRHRLARALPDLHLCRPSVQLPERHPGRNQVDPGRRARERGSSRPSAACSSARDRPPARRRAIARSSSLARITPYIFVVGLLTGIALLVHYLLPLLLGTVDQCDDARGGTSLAGRRGCRVLRA